MANARGLALDDHGELDGAPLARRETRADLDSSQQTVGEELRKARQSKGLTPEIIWRDLKIAPHHLAALETGSFETLPGRVYVVGFVRSYARYLGLDVEKCLARLKAELSGPEINAPPVSRPSSQFEPAANFGIPPVESPKKSGPDVGLFSPRERVEISPDRGVQQYVVIGLIGLVLLYGGYNVFSSARLTSSSAVLPVPTRLATEAGITPPKAKTAAIAINRQTAPVTPPATTITSTGILAAAPVAVQSLANVQPTTDLRVEPDHTLPKQSSNDSVRVGAHTGNERAPASALDPRARSTKAADAGALRPQTLIEPLPDLSPRPNVARSTVATSVLTRPKIFPQLEPALPGTGGVASAEAPPPKEPVPVAADHRPTYRPPLPLGARYGLENGNSRVVLRLHRSIRISVKGSRNRVFIDRILGAGATYRVPNASGVKLSASDAGAVEVILDGNTVGFAGKDGIAAKSVGLDPPSIIRRYHWQ